MKGDLIALDIFMPLFLPDFIPFFMQTIGLVRLIFIFE